MVLRPTSGRGTQNYYVSGESESIRVDYDGVYEVALLSPLHVQPGDVLGLVGFGVTYERVSGTVGSAFSPNYALLTPGDTSLPISPLGTAWPPTTVNQLFEINSGNLWLDDEPYTRATYETRTFSLAVNFVSSSTTVSGNINLGTYLGSPLPTVNIDVYQAGNLIESHPVSLAANGDYSFSRGLSGTYDLFLRSNHFLNRRLSGVQLGTNVAGVNATLINGDIDGDNSITVFDYDRLSAAFDSTTGGSGWDVQADLDGDGAVTVFDYDILSQNFDQSGDSI